MVFKSIRLSWLFKGNVATVEEEKVMNEADFKHSKYLVIGTDWEMYRGSYMVVCQGFADETTAVNWMKRDPSRIYYLCPGPYMVQKPKPRESEVVYMS